MQPSYPGPMTKLSLDEEGTASLSFLGSLIRLLLSMVVAYVPLKEAMRAKTSVPTCKPYEAQKRGERNDLRGTKGESLTLLWRKHPPSIVLPVRDSKWVFGKLCLLSNPHQGIKLNLLIINDLNIRLSTLIPQLAYSRPKSPTFRLYDTPSPTSCQGKKASFANYFSRLVAMSQSDHNVLGLSHTPDWGRSPTMHVQRLCHVPSLV